jgi:hypothetical protein
MPFYDGVYHQAYKALEKFKKTVFIMLLYLMSMCFLSRVITLNDILATLVGNASDFIKMIFS